MVSKLQNPAKADNPAGLFESHGISIDVPGPGDNARPSNIRHVSSPAYESPMRHHRRKQSSAKEVKETLHARSEYTNSEDDGGAIHRINQYHIKQEIGRGSFGAVHLAVDQYGQEYAVKEFSKSRLRKRAQSNILRRPYGARRPGHLSAGMGFNSPLHRHSASEIHDQEGGDNPLFLIKEEIAIMKKLNHDNLVSLIEVLDDPTEDSLYMVLEMCKKGVVMKVGMDEKADPYDDESCRCWFRDLILGIEYLHAQGVVHRDIKPDNLLLTEDDVLKIVDFGVSEMFEKSSEMLTAKSAGSPAFLPPELCVAKHGDISGKAADIWSMGITLYCLRFGKIPFEQHGVLQLYESIKNDQLEIPSDCDDEDFRDLITKLLEKDPSKRIKMPELREHPWVTKGGTDPLLSAEENTANLVEPPTEEETNDAITGKFSNMLVLVQPLVGNAHAVAKTSQMKAVKRFKNAVARKRPHLMNSILGQDVRIVQPPLSISEPRRHFPHHKTRSVDTHDRRPIEKALVVEGVHRDIDPTGFNDSLLDRDNTAVAFSRTSPATPAKPKAKPPVPDDAPVSPKRDLDANPQDHRSSSVRIDVKAKDHGGKGHAHDPLSDHLFLAIGPGGSDEIPDPPAVSDSPPAAGLNIYETAYHEEIQRIREKQGGETKLYLTRRVETKKEFQEDERLVGGDREGSTFKSGLSKIFDRARKKGRDETAAEAGKASEGPVESGTDNEMENTQGKNEHGGGQATEHMIAESESQ